MFFPINQARKFYLFLGAILLLHCFLLIHRMRIDEFKTITQVPQQIKVKLLQETSNEKSIKQKRQIVQSEDTDTKEKKDNSYLSDKDRSFDRQTVAKTIDTFNKAALGNGDVNQIAKKSAATKNSKKNIKLSDLGIEAGAQSPETFRAPASASQKGLKNGSPSESGLSATNDYVQEVALGDFTHLNTVEYKYYGFFHRIRQKLEQFWGKSIQEKSQAIFRSGRTIASQDYVTSLQVTLNEKGEIIGVKILGASGVRELDEAAVESFNQAGPFPNPPKGLLVNGKATIEWGFVVKS